MSRLYHSETGQVIPSVCEELTSYRRARKALDLPGTREPAQLYVLARSYPDNSSPLRIKVNGVDLPAAPPDETHIYNWRSVDIPASLLRRGTQLVRVLDQFSGHERVVAGDGARASGAGQLCQHR